MIDYSAVDDVVDAVAALTDGRGAESAIEAVGMDADGSFADRFLQTLKVQPDRMIALHQALGSVRRGGAVSVNGVYGGWMPSFPVGDLFDKAIQLRWVRPTSASRGMRSRLCYVTVTRLTPPDWSPPRHR